MERRNGKREKERTRERERDRERERKRERAEQELPLDNYIPAQRNETSQNYKCGIIKSINWNKITKRNANLNPVRPLNSRDMLLEDGESWG